MKYKVRLVAEIRITASTEFEMEAESEDKVYELAYGEYKDRVVAYNEQLKLYHQGKRDYPEQPIYWSVDNDDIEGNLHDRDIEVDSVTEVKDEGELPVDDKRDRR